MIGQFWQLPRSLYFLFAGTIITRMGAFVFPYLTIYLSEARGHGFDRVGLILSVGGVGLLVGNFAGGWSTDKCSRKWTLVVALLLNAAGFAGLAGHYDSGWVYACFLLVGYVGSGMYTPAANTVVADLTREDIRPFAYTVNYVCINLGMASGPLIGGFLASISYRWLFIGDVATSLLCAGLIMIGVVETRHESAKPQGIDTAGGSYPAVWLRHPQVLLFCLAYFFLICPLMGLEFAVPPLVKTVFGSSLVYVGVIYTINAVCILSFSFVIERLIRGRNEYLMMVASGLFWTAGLVILLIGFSVTALMVCTVVWTIGEIIASILVPSFIAKNVAAEVKGRFMALNDIMRSFAGVICPIGLGFAWNEQGPVAVVIIITALPAVGTLCYVVLLAVNGYLGRTPSPPAVTVEA